MRKGQVVDFEFHMTPDGKPRADRIIAVLNQRDNLRAQVPRENPRPQVQRDSGPPAVLSEAVVEDMTRFLEEKGGVMDYGKFTRRFRGFKKSQLGSQFTLVPEASGDAGGRWQITLPGVEALSPEERDLMDTSDPPPENSGATGRPDLEPLGHFEGVIKALDKSYGFIKSEDVEGDIYFKRSELPEEARELPKAKLVGLKVAFECLLTADDKPRAEQIILLEQEEELGDGSAQADMPVEEEEARKDKQDKPPAPELDQETVDEMNVFLEEQGGWMDYGRFAAHFAGKKKTQVEPHFTLIQDKGGSGGRWTIARIGVEPPAEEERAALHRPPAKPKEPKAPRQQQSVSPSEGLWLIGHVKKWSDKGDFGFLIADGADDVFVHRNDLPQEAISRNMVGVEMAFELGSSEDGKLKVLTARPLVGASANGGWELRRR